MSRFDAALDLVLRELDDRRRAGSSEWRASSASLERLRATRPPAGPAPIPSANPAPPAPAPIFPMPKPAQPDGPSLFGDDVVPPVVAPRGKAAAPANPPGVYEPVTDPNSTKAERLAQLRSCPQRLPCAKCPYGRGEHGHIVFGVGNVDTEVMFVGEAPGAEEDIKGEPFVGRAGQLLNKIVNTMGFKREDIYLANVLKCRPDTPGQTYGNRPPRPDEMESCRPCLFEQIDIIQPKAIVALGATAMKGLLDLDAPMRDLRGRWHDYKGIPVMATYHPSYLLRNQAPGEKRKVWEDLLMVKERLGHEITERDRGYFLIKE